MRATEPVITVRGLCKSFGPRTVLAGIDLSVMPGETLVVLGRSGTGKSVLLKNIVGLMDPDRGRVTVLGQDIHALREADRLRHRKRIGYVFQGAALFDSLTVRENVGFVLDQQRQPSAEVRERVRQRLAMVGLEHTLDQYPSELSGGMRKRVGLARALIDLPKVILYDEPTTGLDPLTTDVINQIVLRLRTSIECASVVVTHDIGSAFTIADRVIMLDGGHIVCQGTPAEIEASDNPWVQHFIAGRALESEAVDPAAFASGRRKRISDSGHRPVVRRDGLPDDTSASTRARLPEAIRRRRRRGDSGSRMAVDEDREAGS